MQSRKSFLAKIFGVLCALCCVIALSFGLAACDSDSETVKSVVGMTVENGQIVIEYSDGSTENIDLGDLKGEDGADGTNGTNGTDGDTPYIGENGNWWIGDEDTNVAATGKGIASVAFNEDGTALIITYTDGTTEEVAFPDLSDEEDTTCEHAHISWYKLEGYAYIATTDSYTGTLLEVCDDCGWAWLTHDSEHYAHQWVDVEAVEPGCSTPGHTAGQECEICGKFTGGEVIPATGQHVWDDGHFVVTEEVGQNVCEQGGYYIYLCTNDNCDAYYLNEDLEIRGHKVSSWTVTNDPTTTTTGELTGKCDECGKTITITLPVLSDENVNNGTYTRVLKSGDGCSAGSVYTYTYTIEAGATVTVTSVLDSTKTATGTYTGETDFVAGFDVTLTVGHHYIYDIDGTEVPVLIDEYYGATHEDGTIIGILEYPGIEIFGNITYNCQQTVGSASGTSGSVYFDCLHCEKHVYIRVQGYHVYNGELVTSLDDECVTYHPATCTTPAYYSMTCDYCGDVVLAAGSLLDADNHVYDEDSVTIVENADGTVTVTYVCTENSNHVYTVTGTIVSERTYTEQGSTCLVTVTERVIEYVGPDGETVSVTLTSTSGGSAHSVVVDGITYYITSVIYTTGSEVANITVEWTDANGVDHSFSGNTIVSDMEVAAIVEFFGNVDQTCEDGGSQAMIDCDVCNSHILIMYQIAHTPTLDADGNINWVTPPTCTTNGEATCYVCGQNYEVTDSALGHNFTIVSYEKLDQVDALGNDFYLTFYCERCSDYGDADSPSEVSGVYDERVAAGNIVEVQKQACNQDLIINIVNYPVTGTSSVINAEGLNLGKSDHHWTNGDILDGSLTVVYTLDEYGEMIEGFINVPISCKTEDAGVAFTYCADCGDPILIYVRGYHTTGNLVQAATHSSAAVYECSVCGDYFFSGTPVAHTWVLDADSVVLPTTSQAGSATYKCECGAEYTLTLPRLGTTDAYGNSVVVTTISENCEDGVVTRYSYTLTFSVTVDSSYTENGWNLSASDSIEYTINFVYDTEATDIGHKFATDDLIYAWLQPEDSENGIMYVGHICTRCGKMIVLWYEGMVDANGNIVENTYEIDVYLDSVIVDIEWPEDSTEGGSTTTPDVDEDDDDETVTTPDTGDVTYTDTTVTIGSLASIDSLVSAYDSTDSDIDYVLVSNDSVTVTATAGFRVNANSLTYEGNSYTHRLQTRTGGSTTANSLKFELAAGATITIYARAASDSARNFNFYDADGNALTTYADVTDTNCYTYTVTVTEAGTYYAWGSNGFNVYDIIITFAE